MTEPTGAMASQDRIELLDALRGFALLGILLANILIFSGWSFLAEEGQVALAGPEAAEWQHRFHKLLVDGKFYTIFSLLFGAGFALQLERLTRRGADGLRIYRRRVLILLGIGLVHCCLIWDGDILTVYALLGLILPLFHRLSGRALLAWGAVFIFLVPLAGIRLVEAMGWPADGGLIGLSDRIAVAIAPIDPKDGVTWLRRPDVESWLAFLASGPFFSWGLRISSWRIAKVLGIMLLGMWVGRRLAAGTLLENRRLLWRVFWLGLLIGLPASAVYALRANETQAHWSSLAGTVPLALAYACAFALAWARACRALRIFAPAGRMALTNYLLQSIVCIIVFYGIGFGQIGYWPPAMFYSFAFVFFAAQIAFSRWWLAHHDQGPMEALWRRWTYAGKQRLTQAPAAV